MFIVETVCYRKTWALFSDERPHKNPGSEPVIVSNLKHALFCTVKVVSTYTETSCIEHGDHINSHLIPFIIINPLNNSMWTAHALSSSFDVVVFSSSFDVRYHWMSPMNALCGECIEWMHWITSIQNIKQQQHSMSMQVHIDCHCA